MVHKSRVIKVTSLESWDFYVSQANNHRHPVVVHFAASWCFFSKFMNKLVEEMALTHKNAVFLVVDVDEVKEVATMMQIKYLPTLVLMKKGAVFDKLIGVNPEEIKKRINNFVQTNHVKTVL